MDQNAQLIKNYLETHRVTNCIPAMADGVETNKLVRRHVAMKRREWRKEQKIRSEA